MEIIMVVKIFKHLTQKRDNIHGLFFPSYTKDIWLLSLHWGVLTEALRYQT